MQQQRKENTAPRGVLCSPAPGYRLSCWGQRPPGDADKSRLPQDGSSNRAGVVVVVVAKGFALWLPGTDVALQRVGGPGARSVDVCPELQAMGFV